MGINQPSEDLALPEDIRAAIERSKNLVTTNEAEALRLQELAISSQYTVNELHKQKIELERQISSLQEKCDSLFLQSKGLEQTIIEQQSLMSSSKEELVSTIADIEKLRVESGKEKAYIAELQVSIREKDVALDMRESLIMAKEIDAENKLAKIKEFAAIL